MQSKILLLLLLLLLFSSYSNAESWDDFSDLNMMWDSQKTIPNQEYEEVIEKLTEKKEEKELKSNKKRWKKLFGTGSTLHNELNPKGEIKEFVNLKSENDGILINVPVNLIVEGKQIEKGFYKVFPERDGESKKIYVNLYQSQFLKAKIEVIETEDDYGEQTLDFAKIIPVDFNFVKLVFGSLDFNAYAYIPYSN